MPVPASARIESAPAPVSPTEEELAAAQENERWYRRERLDLPLTAAECEAAQAAQEAAQEAADAGQRQMITTSHVDRT